MLFAMLKCAQSLSKTLALSSALAVAALGVSAQDQIDPQDVGEAGETPLSCEAHLADPAARTQFFADLFDVTDQRIVGWQQDMRLGLYGFGTKVFDPSFQTTVRSLREISGLQIDLVGQGGAVNAALVYVNFRSLLIDPNLTELIDAMGGAGSFLFKQSGTLFEDPDGYHYHFRLNPEKTAINLAVVFVDKRRFSREQVTSLLPKMLSDIMFVAGASDAVQPSFRNAPNDVLDYLSDCPRVPRMDLSLIDQVYEPQVLGSAEALVEADLNTQPLELLPSP